MKLPQVIGRTFKILHLKTMIASHTSFRNEISLKGPGGMNQFLKGPRISKFFERSWDSTCESMFAGWNATGGKNRNYRAK